MSQACAVGNSLACVSSGARNIGQARRWSRGLLDRAGHEAGQGDVVTAAGLLLLYAVGL